jgi:site-specific DNA recombinase
VRYRYYVSRHLQHGTPANDATTKGTNGVRIPAKELEQLVVRAIVAELRDPIAFARRLGVSTDGPRYVAALLRNAEAMIATLDGKRGLPVRTLLGRIIQRVTVQEDAVKLALDPAALCSELGLDQITPNPDAFFVSIPACIRRTGLAVRFVLETGKHASEGPIDQKLIAAIVKGRAWWRQLQADPSLTVTGLAAIEGASPSYIDRILRLAFLSPAIVDAILSGEAPAELNLHRLKDVQLIAPSWAAQHRLMGLSASRA